MALMNGSVSVTRFNVPAPPQEIDFDEAAFRAITPGSEVRESVGFVPYEPGADYAVGVRRWAFRVRVDQLRPDATAVRERVKELVAAEAEATGNPFVGAKKRRKLKNLAEEELIREARPRTRIVECYLDGDVLTVASTAKSQLGRVVTLLRRVGVIAEPKAPWIDRGGEDAESMLVELDEPGESVLGCRFLGALVGDALLTFEPVDGRVVLQTRQARVTLVGEVLPDLVRYLERGAEVLRAKLTTGEIAFNLDGPTWRVSSLKVDSEYRDHWAERLAERVDGIAAVYELLEEKYAELDPVSLPAPAVREGTEGEVSEE